MPQEAVFQLPTIAASMVHSNRTARRNDRHSWVSRRQGVGCAGERRQDMALFGGGTATAAMGGQGRRPLRVALGWAGGDRYQTWECSLLGRSEAETWRNLMRTIENVGGRQCRDSPVLRRGVCPRRCRCPAPPQFPRLQGPPPALPPRLVRSPQRQRSPLTPRRGSCKPSTVSLGQRPARTRMHPRRRRCQNLLTSRRALTRQLPPLRPSTGSGVSSVQRPPSRWQKQRSDPLPQ